jgi:TonB family protein
MKILRLSTIVFWIVLAGFAFSQEATPPTAVGDGGAEIQLGRPVHVHNPDVPKGIHEKWFAAVLGATIKTDGTFDEISELGGNPEFEKAAVAAVRQWRYTPATLNGSPVESRVFVTFVSEKKHVRATVEPDLPFPTKPDPVIQDRLRDGGGHNREMHNDVAKRVDPPRVDFTPDPEYSEAARAAKNQGVAVLGVTVDKGGRVADLWVVRRLGLGLDQKALQAVRQWKFTPASKDGVPVAVQINVEVQFRLY